MKELRTQIIVLPLLANEQTYFPIKAAERVVSAQFTSAKDTIVSVTTDQNAQSFKEAWPISQDLTGNKNSGNILQLQSPCLDAVVTGDFYFTTDVDTYVLITLLKLLP
jgi:hypothetical protein